MHVKECFKSAELSALLREHPPEAIVRLRLSQRENRIQAQALIEESTFYAFLLTRLRHCAEWVTIAAGETLSHQARLISSIQGQLYLGRLLKACPPPVQRMAHLVNHPTFIRQLYSLLAYPQAAESPSTFLAALPEAWLNHVRACFVAETRARGLLLPVDVLALTTDISNDPFLMQYWLQNLAILLIENRSAFPPAAQDLLVSLSKHLTILDEVEPEGLPLPESIIGWFKDQDSEHHAIADWIVSQVDAGRIEYSEITIAVPDSETKDNLTQTLTQSGVPVTLEGLSLSVLPLVHLLYDGFECLNGYWQPKTNPPKTQFARLELEERYQRHLDRLLPYGEKKGQAALLKIFETYDAQDKHGLSIFCWQLLDWGTAFSIENNALLGQAMGHFLRQLERVSHPDPIGLDELLAYFPAFWRTRLKDSPRAVNIALWDESLLEDDFSVLIMSALNTGFYPLSSDWIDQLARITGQYLLLSGYQTQQGETLPKHEILQPYSQQFGWHWETIDQSKTVPTIRASQRFEGSGLWGQKTQAESKSFPSVVVGSAEPLVISPSAVSNYMKCPRRYFYRHVLNLKEPSNEAANMGTLVHRLMEILNTQHFPNNYTANQLEQLATILFDTKLTYPQKEAAGFKTKDLESLDKLEPVTREDAYNTCLLAIQDLASNQSFKNYFGFVQADVVRIEAEKKLSLQPVDGLKDVLLNGSIDAVLHHRDGRITIVDYKYYGENRFTATKPQTCLDNWQKNLKPLEEIVSEADTENPTFQDLDSNPRDYQLLLYALALRTLPEYRDRLDTLRLQIIRPAFTRKPEQGSIALTLSMLDILDKQDAICRDLEQWILNPIRNTTHFLPQPVSRTCRNCGFKMICDASVNQNDGELDDDDAG